ncbi:MAG: 30S ribosome-binding factor RbfA [Flavobacteriaceae bacterium]
METQRQRKVAGVIQRDIADILQRAATDGGLKGTLISVTQVEVTVDLSIAKVYLSIFPKKRRTDLLEGISANSPQIKHELARRTRNQLRKVPELLFFLDESLDRIEDIEKSLTGKSGNPIENPELLEKRKKR